MHNISWSLDSKSIAIASQIGAALYQSRSGEEIRLSCGHWFEKRATPPTSTARFLQTQNLCER